MVEATGHLPDGEAKLQVLESGLDQPPCWLVLGKPILTAAQAKLPVVRIAAAENYR